MSCSHVCFVQAIRPFFSMPGMIHSQHLSAYGTQADTTALEGTFSKNANGNSNSTNPSSSEGFTSFFTTTTDESGGDKKASTKTAPTDNDRVQDTTPEDGITDDNASMAVFARAKRKYARNMQQKQLQKLESTTTSSSDTSSSGVRDQNGADETNHHHNNGDHTKVMSRMVTDVSSSNPTTTSGSGSGDNGMNTTTGGSGSGTGSNQGSSGSGNDGKGSSEELAKEDSNSGGDGMNGSDGSSNKINSHRGGNQATSSIPEDAMASTVEKLPQQTQQKSLLTVAGDGSHVATTTNTATREQKMLVKKRKRIVMRREYEAQQRQMSSSESSGDSTEHFFPPGRPLTLDQVLVFSKIPRYVKVANPAIALHVYFCAHTSIFPLFYSRLVIQGTPPFLVVHMNAACCRLTGIDAHLLVGKPISALLSIPSFSFEDGDFDQEAVVDAITDKVPSAATMKPAVRTTSTIEATVNSSLEITADNEKGDMQMTIDRLIMTSGCDGHLHLVNVKTRLLPPSVDTEEQHKMLCRLSIAPIVVSKDIVGSGNTTENHDQTKRARYQYNQAGSPDMSQLPQPELKFPLITHFVIQFEMYDNEHYGDSMESLSSPNSVDGQIADAQASNNAPSNAAAHQLDETKIGLTGTNSNVDSNNIDHNTSNVEGTDMDGSVSVQSSDREPIVAIG
jgi:hypothetical protein